MNILIYNWKDKKNPDRGGAEIIVFELARRLVVQGHQVTIFSRSFPHALSEENIDGVHVVRRGGTFSTYWYGYRYYRTLSHKPDLVIDMLNTLFWQTPLYVRDRPILAYVNQLAKEVLFFELPPLISHLAYWLEKMQFIPYRVRKTSFICYAQSVKDDLASLGILPERIRTFPLGIEHQRFFPGTKSEAPTFLCINRLVKMKRTDLCIRAMEEVVKKYPNAILSIVGFGYDKTRLAQLIATLHLEKNVQFKTIPFFVKGEEERTRLMQSAWALLFPSVKEGWGMTVTECAACGTPSIVSNVTGLRDAVQDGNTGIILSARPTLEELAKAMVRLIEEKEWRIQLSENAVQWAKRFTWEQSFEEFEKVILQSGLAHRVDDPTGTRH